MRTLPWNEATEVLCLTCRQVVPSNKGTITEHDGRDGTRCPASSEQGVS